MMKIIRILLKTLVFILCTLIVLMEFLNSKIREKNKPN